MVSTFIVHHFVSFLTELTSYFWGGREKDAIYTGAQLNIKKTPQSLTCNIAAISAWIFVQQRRAEALWQDLSNDT